MQIKSITTVAGVNEIDFGNDDSQTTAHFYWFKNLSDSTLYVSAKPDPVAGKDDVAELSAKGAASVETDEGKVYVLGAGKVEIHRTNSKFCPFELPSTGSGGGGGGSITVDSELSETSENPLQNKATTAAINEVKSDLTKTQEDVAENAAALNTKSDVNHIHDITASGNPVTLTNLQGEVPFSEITVSGKNLMPRKSFTSIETNGITFILNNDGSITAKGASTANIFFNFTGTFSIPDGIYCLSGTPSEYLNDNCYMSIRSNTPPIGEKTNFDELNGSMSVIFHDDAYCIIRINSGVDFGDGVTFYPQLELGSTSTEYEPPITGRDLTVNVSGKNLMKPNKSTVTLNGITATMNDDGSVALNGTATANTYIGMWNNLYARSIGVGKITINAIDGQSISTYFMGIDRREGGSYIDRIAQSITNNGVGEITQEDVENNRYFYVWVFIAANYTANNLVFRPQLELGDTATPYEPYHGAKYTITPDSNPYVVPNDIRQVEGLNNISVSAGELSVVGVQKNAAIDKIWDILNTLKVWASLGLIPNLNCYPLIPTLISNTGSNGSASCNSDVTFGTAESAYVAFDRDTTTFLAYANENVSGGWAMYEFNSLVCISKMQALTGTGISTNSFDFHFEYYDESTDSWKMYGEELNVTGLNANNYKKFEVEAGEITTSKVRIISHTEKVEQTNWQVFEFQVYGYMSI